jgi:hypothetical protein
VDLTDEQVFEIARLIYPGPKKGLEVEFSNFKKHHKNWKEVLPLLQPAIIKQNKVHSWLRGSNRFEPSWKHFQTWINQSCWGYEFPEYEAAQKPTKTHSSPAKQNFIHCGQCKGVATVFIENRAYCVMCASKLERNKEANEHDWGV